jgi:hypothetical protein
MIDNDDRVIFRQPGTTVFDPPPGFDDGPGRRAGRLFERRPSMRRLVWAAAGLVVIVVAFGLGASSARHTARPAGTIAAGPGSTRTVGGVPMGYAHSEAGAVAAATNYMKVLGSPALLEPSERRALVAAMVVSDEREETLAKLTQAAGQVAKVLQLPTDGLGDKRATLTFQTIPVRWRLDSYDGRTAQASIWTTGVIGTTTVPVQEAWGTFQITLRWADNDWRYVTSSSTAGPVPAGDRTPPTDTADLVATTAEFQGYTYAPAGE